ncbi:MAG: nucleoside-triphosphatase [Dehalococcoidia bacterium]|nr:nucleoside-triphosphatase [Dehalococcoidia bacterium]
MHLFLQGKPCVGKSSLIRKELEQSRANVAGFITQRLKEAGRTIGYRVLSVTEELPPLEAMYIPNQSGIFLLNGQMDVSALEVAILQVEKDSQNKKCSLIVLDEVGGVELKSERFMKPLLRIINAEKPCIGVLKSAQNLSHAILSLNLDNEYLSLHRHLEQTILSKGKLISVASENKSATQEYIARYLQQLPKSS